MFIQAMGPRPRTMPTTNAMDPPSGVCASAAGRRTNAKSPSALRTARCDAPPPGSARRPTNPKRHAARSSNSTSHEPRTRRGEFDELRLVRGRGPQTRRGQPPTPERALAHALYRAEPFPGTPTRLVARHDRTPLGHRAAHPPSGQYLVLANLLFLTPPISGAGVVRGDQRASGVAPTAAEAGDDQGREHHRGAPADEEPRAGAGSGDASGEEGQTRGTSG